MSLEERRAYLLRLTPDRALEAPEQALEFLVDRGLLTRTEDSALPSFFAACHEEPYASGSSGFGSWPKTKYPWYFELAERPDVHELQIHNGKSILLTADTLALVDAICRDQLARKEREAKSAPLLEHLRRAGPSTPDDLQTELGLKPKELRALRAPLERCGAIVSRNVRIELENGGHRHTSELLRFDDAYPHPVAQAGGLDDFIVAAVRASVVAPEREVRRWFSWRELFPRGYVDRLVEEGRLVRPEPGVVAAADS